MHEEFVLIDAPSGVGERSWKRHRGHVAVDFRTLHGGKQEGSQLLTVHTPDLDVVLIPTRGLGVLSVSSHGTRLGWDSPIRDVVHPSFVNLEARGGLGWLDGFNEFLCRCGLEWSGHPGSDRFVNNVGDEATMDVTLHGKIANIPVSRLAVTIDDDGVTVDAETHERMFHGPKLVLRTSVRIPSRGTSFSIDDTVENHGSRPQEFQLMYHCNIGAPLLMENAKVIVRPVSIEPFNARAAEGLDTYDTYSAPMSGFVEQVYCIHPHAKDGIVTAVFHDAPAARGMALSYDCAMLPCLTLWKHTAAVSDGYVTGIEPGTSFPRTRRLEREAGRVPVLPPGERRVFRVTVDVLSSVDAVRAAVERAQ